MTRLAIVGALAAVLLGATAASAKGPSLTLVCGRSLELPTERACVALGDRDQLLYKLIDLSEPFSLRGRPAPAPYYSVSFRFPGATRWNWSYLYVPGRGAIRVTTSGGKSVYWRSAPSTITEAFEILRTRVRPFPAPRRWR